MTDQSNDPFGSAAACMTSSPRDWSLDHRDAWLYGIIVGWDEDALLAVAKHHGWTDPDVERLRGLRATFILARELLGPNSLARDEQAAYDSGLSDALIGANAQPPEGARLRWHYVEGYQAGIAKRGSGDE